MNNYSIDDVYIGLQESFSVCIDKSKQSLFKELTGDINSIHIDKAYAKSLGYDNVLVYGMLAASYYSTLVGSYLPGNNCIFQGIDIVFTNPTYIGDVLKVQGEVVLIHDILKYIEIKAQILNQRDEKISRAKIKVGMFAK